MTDFPEELKALPKFWGAEDARVYDITGVKAESGWQILFSNYDAGFSLEEHTHESENLGVILDGELRFTLNGETKAYGPGEWYRVPKGAPHSASYPVATRSIDILMLTEDT